MILNIIDSRVDSQSCFEANTLWYETPQLKRSYAGTAHHTNYTHKDEAFKFIELVSGFVKWEYNSSGFVGGTFKQVDNPAAVDITDANIVHCGSVITQCQAIIILALNVGNHIMANSKKDDQMKSIVERGARYLVKRYIRITRPYHSLIFTILKGV